MSRSRTVVDDLGTEVVLSDVRRVISLVPSLTETIAHERPELVVGCTDWCTHPAGLAAARIGGTKWPKLTQIVALRPDVVIANREENRREDVEALRADGVPVYVTDPNTLDEALASLGRLLSALRLPRSSWLDVAAREWESPVPRLVGTRTACFIWRRPWMAVGADTFAGDVLERLGLVNVVREPRYPKVDPASLDAELVVLPDEPYEFSASDGPEAFARTPCALVSGRHLSWYGPSLVEAKNVLVARILQPVTSI